MAGHGRSWLVAMPALHAVATALAGGALAFGIASIAAWAINRHFASHLSPGEAAVHLGPPQAALGLLGALVVSLLPALWGGWRASNVEAADELRDP